MRHLHPTALMLLLIIPLGTVVWALAIVGFWCLLMHGGR